MNAVIDRPLQTLRLRYLAPLMRQLDDFWSWWSGELFSMLPDNMQAALTQHDQRLRIELDGPELVVSAGAADDTREVGRIPGSPTDEPAHEFTGRISETLLLLPADKVLVKRLTLPLAAEENLREVLAFEMDRQTPFTADEVYYDYVIMTRDTGDQTLSVDIVLSPRALVDNIIERMAVSGLYPDVVSGYAKDSGNLLCVNLLPAADRKRKTDTTRRRNTLLAATNLLLVAVAISIPLLQKHQVIRTLEPQIAQAVTQAKVGNELRQQVERLADASGFLTSKKQAELSVMQVFNEVTGLLPDHTWINRLEISSQEIQLQGQSTSSAALIPLLEASPLLQEVRFRSPVMRIPSTGEERFHLSAVLDKEPAR